jgi:hypothetical protein
MSSSGLSSISTSLCSDKGCDQVFLQILHHNPPIGRGFGIPSAIYCVNVGHSFLWCPFILHVVHQMASYFSLFLLWFR